MGAFFMKKSEKIFAVQDLTERLKQAKSIVLADYRGLKVSQMGELRSLVKKAGGELMVVKNSLLKLAAQQGGLPREFTEGEFFRGPTAITISYQDELAPLKAINDFAKTASLPSFKSGIWEKRVLSAEEVQRLASLPSKNELMAKLVGQLFSPTYSLVNVLIANHQKLIYVLSARMRGGEIAS